MGHTWTAWLAIGVGVLTCWFLLTAVVLAGLRSVRERNLPRDVVSLSSALPDREPIARDGRSARDRLAG